MTQYDAAATPMDELNVILWKSVKGVDSVMPPVRAFALIQTGR